MKLLFNRLVASFTYDNVTASGRMLDTRGQSNKFLNGTHMVVHKVNVYLETKYNDLRVENSYDQEKIVISPDGMRKYEDIDLGSLILGQDAFVNHKLIPTGEHPDTTGKREKAYSRLSKIASYLICIENNFHVPESNFDQCPNNITKSTLVAFINVVCTRTVQIVLRSTREFRQTCALDCFPRTKEVTQSLLLGVSGVDEKDAKGSTAVAIELTHIFGMICLGPGGRMQRMSRLDQKS